LYNSSVAECDNKYIFTEMDSGMAVSKIHRQRLIAPEQSIYPVLIVQ
jgi:hypothetical protein